MAFRFDPRDLIAGPFVRCPNCGGDQFGIHIVAARSYQRRCRNCWHGVRFELPMLSRKVLYIDQFVISNMMKALDRTHPRHHTTADDPFWRALFERLDRLVKLQVVICPPSDVHRSESLVSAYHAPLKRMSEQLSQGVTFDEVDAISQRQLYVALNAWLQGQPAQFEFAPERVTHGGINDWKESLIISVRMDYPQPCDRCDTHLPGRGAPEGHSPVRGGDPRSRAEGIQVLARSRNKRRRECGIEIPCAL
jgi:hypothetical protein